MCYHLLYKWSINHSIDWSFWLIDWLHRLQSIRYGFIGFIFSYFLAINCGLNKRKIEIEKIESANNTHTTISKMFPVNRKKVKALTITMGNFSSSFSPILIDLCTKISMICMCKWRINQNRKRTEQIFTIDSKYGHLDMTIFGQTDVIIIISHFHSFFFLVTSWSSSSSSWKWLKQMIMFILVFFSFRCTSMWYQVWNFRIIFCFYIFIRFILWPSTRIIIYPSKYGECESIWINVEYLKWGKMS